MLLVTNEEAPTSASQEDEIQFDSRTFDEELDLRSYLFGLTLEEAVRFLTPRNWNVQVHRYDEDEYENDPITARTVSLDIQDGKIWECIFLDAGDVLDV